jgi:spermidine synthase
MIRLTAIALTVLTGFAGLVYEVTWQKYLAALLGSHAEATAAVLAIFLGGLALGYALFGWATRRILERAQRRGRPPRLLYFYALVEAGIGVYALVFPALFGMAQSVSLLGPTESEGLSFAFDVGLSALLIGPPAVLMGGTIPILTVALAGDLAHATRIHAWIYGFNTLGAFAGALAAGFVLIPRLGLDGTLFALACVNLGAAIVFSQLDRGAASVTPDPSEPAVRPVAGFAAWAAVALLAGFAMMALQTTFNRLGALAFGSSEFTFSMVVAVFVLCIAIGSLAVSALPRIPRVLVVVSQWLLVALLFLLYVAIADVTYWAHVLRVLFRQEDAAFYLYQAVVFLALLIALALPIGLSGALLPLLFDQLRREVRELGSMAGRLYAWNTLGSLLGALLGGYLLLIWLDLHHVYRIAMACLAVGASILTVLTLRPLPRSVAAVILLPILLAIALLPPWPPERLTAGLFRWRQPTQNSFLGPEAFFDRRQGGRVIFYDDDPTSTVSVHVPQRGNDNQSIVVNGKSDGALKGDYATMALSALLPALMAEHIARCFVIGLGTGVTTGELAALEDTREIRVAEISRGVIEANPLFDHGNLAASKSPKVEIRRGDAYRTLLRSPGRYDLIVSEPSNPWVTGVEMLYSREFLEAARAHLAPGGVYAQWFHLYESDVEVVELVLRTYTTVFPHVSVWFALGQDLLLLGFDHPDRALDVHALEERFERPDFQAAFARVGIDSFPQLLAHELLPLGTLHAAPLPGEIHSLRHPILSHRAARAFFRGQTAPLPPYLNEAQQAVAERNGLLRRYVGGGDTYPEDILEVATSEVCRFHRRQECATLFARWSYDHPDSPRLRAALARERNNGGEKPGLGRRRLAALRPLFAGRAPVNKAGGSPLQQAARLTNRFVAYFNYLVPFDRRALEAAWSRCRGPDCAEARLQAESRVGGLHDGAGNPGTEQAHPPATPEPATTPGYGTDE